MKLTKLVLAFTLPVATWAQATVPPSITAVGSATASATPDVARVDISVVTQAGTAQDATAANAMQTSAVITALQSFVTSSSNIKTVSYYLSPVYNNPPPGQSATIIGYMVSNTVEVTLTDLTQIGKAIDTAIQAGANRVQGVSFDVMDRSPVMAQALKTAASRARSQADAIASGLNVHTGAVLRASEGVNTVTPQTFGAAAAAGATTPIETGVVMVQASVTLEVAITP